MTYWIGGERSDPILMNGGEMQSVYGTNEFTRHRLSFYYTGEQAKLPVSHAFPCARAARQAGLSVSFIRQRKVRKR
jgi:hypothetical protein